jgi:hypothetical protein
MRPERWWTVILTMGLFMGLSPLNAQAGPNRTFAPQPNRQAFTRPQPRAFAPQVNRQAFSRPQPRAVANGWNRQPHQWQQPRGNAHGWNGQHRQWQQPRGNAYGWNGHQRQGDHRNAHGWNGPDRQWRQPHNGQHPRGQAAGWNGQQHRQSSGPGHRAGYQQSQSPNQNQESSHRSYTPIGYSGTRPSVTSGAFTAPSNSSGQRGRSYSQSGFHNPQSSGSSHQAPAEPTQVPN